MYKLECSDNDGFEDSITVGQIYNVIMFQSNSVMIETDKGQEKWLGEVHFRQCEYKD